ncbi:MAG: GNAT family N-acetyltransferase [Chitinophagales bacterium]
MNVAYRKGTKDDLQSLKKLAIKSWTPFQEQLSEEHFTTLKKTISSDKTYEELIAQSTCIVCVADNDTVIGMAFIIPNGNPTDIYLSEWSYIRFVSVDPDFSGQGIGRKLTTMCIDIARENREKTIALHTSEIMDKARHMYESLGFTILRELDQRLGKRYWLYTLALDDNE